MIFPAATEDDNNEFKGSKGNSIMSHLALQRWKEVKLEMKTDDGGTDDGALRVCANHVIVHNRELVEINADETVSTCLKMMEREKLSSVPVGT